MRVEARDPDELSCGVDDASQLGQHGRLAGVSSPVASLVRSVLLRALRCDSHEAAARSPADAFVVLHSGNRAGARVSGFQRSEPWDESAVPPSQVQSVSVDPVVFGESLAQTAARVHPVYGELLAERRGMVLQVPGEARLHLASSPVRRGTQHGAYVCDECATRLSTECACEGGQGGVELH